MNVNIVKRLVKIDHSKKKGQHFFSFTHLRLDTNIVKVLSLVFKKNNIVKEKYYV